MRPGLLARLRPVGLAICLAAIAVLMAAAFRNLGGASLWLDELYTAHFADPRIATLPGLIDRAAEDVHPPLYYMLVWAMTRAIPGDFAIVARGISAVAASLAILALYVAFPARVGRAARIIACGVAAGSALWFEMAQEARSYALVWLIVIGMFGLALRIRHAAAANAPLGGLLAGFLLLGVLGGLTHFYVVPVAGALVAMLMLTARTWRQSLGIALTGIAILVPILLFMRWHAPRIVLDPANTWFETDAVFLIVQTLRGIFRIVRDDVERIVPLLAVSAALLAVLARLWTDRGRRARTPLPDAYFLILAALLTVGMALAVTLLYAPSYSFRVIVTLAPAYWMAVGLIADRALAGQSPRLGALLVLGSAGVFAFQAASGLDRGPPAKEPWRETAAIVAALPGCEGAVLPVATARSRVTSTPGATYTYGYYLPDGASRTWLTHPSRAAVDYPNTPEAEALIADRVSGRDPCPLLLWSVHYGLPYEMRAILNDLRERFGTPVGTSIVMKRFFNPEAQGIGQRLGTEVGYAYLILVERSGAAGG